MLEVRDHFFNRVHFSSIFFTDTCIHLHKTIMLTCSLLDNFSSTMLLVFRTVFLCMVLVKILRLEKTKYLLFFLFFLQCLQANSFYRARWL